MYVYGSGFIATKLKKIKIKKKDNVIIYEAGVSHSKSNNKKIYLKEIQKLNFFLKNYNKKNLLIYISSTSVLDRSLKKNSYVKNKKKVEEIIKRKLDNYLILRLPQIVGKSNNPYTITNFIYKKIAKSQNFKVWSNVKRNLIDIDDIVKITKRLIKKKLKYGKVLNIQNPKSTYVEDIALILSKILNKKAKYKLVKYKYTGSKNLKIKKNLNFNLIISKYFKSKFYTENILKKYYK